MTDQDAQSHLTRSDYQLTLEAAGIGCWDWDLCQHTQTWSRQCRALFGLQTEDEPDLQSFLASVERKPVRPGDRPGARIHVPPQPIRRVLFPHTLLRLLVSSWNTGLFPPLA